ncbi:hypothetical protein [Pseudodesulfovibrio methanolicus]|uniref:Uncharacterized protein n=1 Tax=Pseudodesulfovibrio methanolicus TaxID=3126690 RepID=A0ABZ2J6M5_9BACT
MQILLSLVCLAALLAAILGLIKPAMVLFFVKPEKQTRLKAFGLYAGVFILGVLLLPAVTKPDASDKYLAQLKEEAKQAEQAHLNKKVKPMAKPVELSMNYKLRPDFRVEVTATTNLPDGTEMLLTVGDKDVAAGFLGQDDSSVEKGRISFAPVGPLPNGNYIATVTVPIPRVQPKAVQAIIGSHGEYLTGELVEDGDFGKTIEQEVSFSVKGSSPSPAIIVKALKKDFKREYDALLKFKDNPDFWQYGFGRGGKYYEWLERVQSLDKQYPSQTAFKAGLLFANLPIIGREYMRSKGRETPATESHRKDIEKALQ